MGVAQPAGMPRRASAACCLAILAIASVGAQSSVHELNDAGWKALRDGYVDRAARLFGEALTLRPDDAVLLFGYGAVAHAQGRQRDAMARLRRALEIEPRLTNASRLLGRIAFDEGDAELAVRTYEHALKFAPNDAQLASELAAWRRDTETHRSFEERRYDRFRVMFEGRAEESLAAQATAVFNSAFWRIGNALGEYPSSTIVAVLYTEKQFRDITRAPEWSAGQYDGRIRVPVAGAAQKPELFERVLTHELAHAIVAGIAQRGVPHWLNEGIAQYFEGADPAAAKKRLQAVGRSIPLKALEGGFGGLTPFQAQVAYDESLLAASVLFDRPAFGWTRLLHRLAGGQTFEDAISNFGLSYADLEAPFRR